MKKKLIIVIIAVSCLLVVFAFHFYNSTKPMMQFLTYIYSTNLDNRDAIFFSENEVSDEDIQNYYASLYDIAEDSLVDNLIRIRVPVNYDLTNYNDPYSIKKITLKKSTNNQYSYDVTATNKTNTVHYIGKISQHDGLVDYFFESHSTIEQ